MGILGSWGLWAMQDLRDPLALKDHIQYCNDQDSRLLIA